MTRIMALDVGEATIGVAISDPLGLTAQPVTTVRRVGPVKDIRTLLKMAGEREVGTIVVGLPLTLSGEEGEAASATRAFAQRLQAAARCPVVTWDERLTTVQAERALLEGDVSRRRRRQVINHIAAAIILQSYLDSRSAGTDGTK